MNIGNFLQRFVIVVAIVFIFGGIIKVSKCLFAASKGLASIFSLDSYKYLAALIGFMMMSLGLYLSKYHGNV